MRLVIKRPSVLLGELQFEYIGIQMKNVSFCSFVKMFIEPLLIIMEQT